MKRASLRKALRYSRAVLPALMLAATSADASSYCMRARELPPISDPQIKGRLEERLRTIPVMKNHQVREVADGFAIAWQEEEECTKLFRCYHLLLDIRDGATTVVFAYRGSGTIWKLGTPLFAWSDPLQDNYSLKAFETENSNWVEVRTPRLLGPVWVGAMPSGELRSCGYLKNM